MNLQSIKLFYFFALALGFILFQNQEKTNKVFIYRANPVQKFLRIQLKKLRLSNPKQKALLHAYVLGSKRGLSKQIKQAHKDLNLLHLFTPSGLHFSSLSVPLFFIIRHHVTKLLILILLYFLFKNYSTYYSINRVISFHILGAGLKLNSIKISQASVFYIVFLFDLFLGSFHLSSLSWYYSFLFWGTLIIGSAYPRIYLLPLFILSILISQIFSQGLVYPLGIIFQFLLTSTFTIFYPLLLISIPTSLLAGITSPLEFLLEIQINIVLYCHKLLSFTPCFYISPYCLFVLFIPTLIKDKVLKWFMIAIILFFSSYPLNKNLLKLNTWIFRRKYSALPPKKQLRSTIKRKNYWLLKFSDGTTCRSTISHNMRLFKCKQRNLAKSNR